MVNLVLFFILFLRAKLCNYEDMFFIFSDSFKLTLNYRSDITIYKFC